MRMQKRPARSLGRVAAAALLTGACLAAPAAAAASPNGLWLRSTGGEIEVFDCDGGLGMKVVKSDSPEKVGKEIMCGAQSDGDNVWRGALLNLDDGETYTGIVTLQDADTLRLEGCVLGGLICKEDIWDRVK